MKKLALVIGAQVGGLTGVHNDVETMSALLDGRGFEVRRREGSDATRDGIFDAYEQLIGDVKPDDPVVIFYSGHGGSKPPDDATGNIDRDHQFIVPTDFEETTSSNFRGIVRLELSVLLARLTARTRNCTVILDCCHSAHMSRDPDLRTKSFIHPSYQDITGHIERLRKRGLPVDVVDPVGNQQAVRVVACQPWQFAFEYTNRDGMSTGLLTESLRLALDDADGQPVTWEAVIARVRRRVQLIAPSQRPEVEGLPRRLVFETETADPTDTIAVAPVGPSRVSLPGARLMGLEVGDTLSIEPAGPARPPEDAVIGTATVDRIGATGVAANVAFLRDHSSIPLGARARLQTTTARRQPVVLTGEGPVADQVRATLSEDPMLRPIGTDDPAARTAVAWLEVGAELLLRDAAGPLAEPAKIDSAGITRMIGNITLLARSAMVRTVTPDPVDQLTDPFTVEWGLVVTGTARPLPSAGAVVYDRDSVYIRLRNDSDRNLFFFLFDCGIDGALTLVTHTNTAGLRLGPNREYVVGLVDQGDLVGVPAQWPQGMPAGLPRPESLLVLVASDFQDLAAIAQVGVRDPWVSKAAIRDVERLRGTGSPLQRMLAQAAVGGSRNLGVDPRADAVRYATRTIEFLSSPLPRPPDEVTRFVIDERPPPSLLLMESPGREMSPITIRLSDVDLPDDQGTMGVDILVITGGPDGVPVYQASTLTLPLSDTVVYHGPAVSYIDIACWASADRGSVAELSTLLADKLDRDEIRRTVTRLAARASAQPASALAVAALGSTALIVDTSSELLSTLDSSALYRTCLLPEENFGAGQHSVAGSLGAKQFSFTYRVD